MPIGIQCPVCKHYTADLKCKAFPDEIPEEILIGEFDHTKKHPEQDNDIVFEEEK
ncbi:MAG: cytoplasmic protein [Candidatus Cloacimonetes bacterium]|nr:cytoplasmic protein [Candidatus Cloacimonadota bacterium]